MVIQFIALGILCVVSRNFICNLLWNALSWFGVQVCRMVMGRLTDVTFMPEGVIECLKDSPWLSLQVPQCVFIAWDSVRPGRWRWMFLSPAFLSQCAAGEQWLKPGFDLLPSLLPSSISLLAPFLLFSPDLSSFCPPSHSLSLSPSYFLYFFSFLT